MRNLILLHHVDSFSSSDTFRRVFVSPSFTVDDVFGPGTKLFVTDESVKKPEVSVYPAASRDQLEGTSSLLCVASAMFPPRVRFSWETQKGDGSWEERRSDEGEQLELGEPGRSAAILLVSQQQSRTHKYRCTVHHEGGDVKAPIAQGPGPTVTPTAASAEELPAATCPPERQPANLPALQPDDWSFQSQLRVKLLCVLSTVLIVKSLVYCCGLSLLMMVTNK